MITRSSSSPTVKPISYKQSITVANKGVRINPAYSAMVGGLEVVSTPSAQRSDRQPIDRWNPSA